MIIGPNARPSWTLESAARMKTDFLGLATEYPLWDGAALLAQNPIALLSLILAIAVMFTLGVVYDRPG